MMCRPAAEAVEAETPMLDTSNGTDKKTEAETDRPRVQEGCASKKRYEIALLCMLGFFVAFGMRCNLGVALPALMNRTDSTAQDNGTQVRAALSLITLLRG